MVRIIKGQGSSDFVEPSVRGRSRIIDGETFNAQLLAREILDEAEQEKLARIDLARQKAQDIENEAREIILKDAQHALFQELVQAFLEWDALFESGRAEIREMSQEIVKKILGDTIEISSNRYDRALSQAYEPAKKLRLQISSKDINQLSLPSLPSWIQIRESSSVCDGTVLVQTDALDMSCSLEAFMMALNSSTENG